MSDLEDSCPGIAYEASFAGEGTDEGVQAFYVFRQSDYCKRPYGVVRCSPLVT